MKLLEAVLLGRFCGLVTVEECVRNIDMHWMSMFSYDKIDEELMELFSEYGLYKMGELTLDWYFIEAETERSHKEYKKGIETVNFQV